MSYRVGYWVISAVQALLFFAYFQALRLLVESNMSVWVLAWVLMLAVMLFPKEWLAEKISGQPRVHPCKRRGDAAEG